MLNCSLQGWNPSTLLHIPVCVCLSNSISLSLSSLHMRALCRFTFPLVEAKLASVFPRTSFALVSVA